MFGWIRKLVKRQELLSVQIRRQEEFTMRQEVASHRYFGHVDSDEAKAARKDLEAMRAKLKRLEERS